MGMDCRGVREIIPAYIKHTASEEEVKAVEEHLCVCEECRHYLSKVIDKESEKDEESTLDKKKDRGSVEKASVEQKEEEPPISVSPPPSSTDSSPAATEDVLNTIKERFKGDIFTYIILGVSILVALLVIILFFKSL